MSRRAQAPAENVVPQSPVYVRKSGKIGASPRDIFERAAPSRSRERQREHRVLRPLILAILLAACASTAPDPVTGDQRVASLLASDNSAATAARNEGLSGLTQLFDEHVVVFAPPVPGFAEGPDAASATLERALGENSAHFGLNAIRAGVSGDGAQGFTFGYVNGQGQTPYLGKYLAYWVREHGAWRIRLFKLIPRPEGDVSLELMAPFAPSLTTTPADAARTQDYADALARREREFSDAAQSEGLGPAFARFGRNDAVNVGGEASFVVSAAAIGAIHPDGPSPLVWSADRGVLVASSGDLGVTWGMLRRTGPTPPGRLAEIPFFTIWARESPDEPWLYIAE